MKQQYPYWLKTTVLLLGVVLLYTVLRYGRFILMPLAISALLAMLLEPISLFIEKLKTGRVIAIILSMLVAFLLFAGIFFLLSMEGLQFADQLPQANERLNDIRDQLLVFFEHTFHISAEQQIDFVQKGLNNIIQKSGTYVSTALGATTSIFSTLAVLPFFVFFMMYYKDMYRTFLHKVSKDVDNGAIDTIIQDIQGIAQNYIVGMLTVVGILAVMNSIGLWIVGLDHILFFAVFSAILAVIPYIGIIMGSLPAILYAFLFYDSLWMPVGVISVFAITQFLEGNFITPNVVGARVSVNPFVALVALVVGGEVWGITGMILFVPLLGIARCVFSEIGALRPYGYLLGNRMDYEDNQQEAGDSQE